jgi:predicted nucleic acid-binding protein
VPAAYFFDSSAIVKRYVRETGTPWVRRLTRRGQPDPIYLARITAVEVISAIARRRQTGKPTSFRAQSIFALFRGHLARRYLIVEITSVLIDDAMRMADTHELRAYDAVQLAAALELNRRWLAAGLGTITMVSADRDLNAAAQAEGLTVDDPNNHP